jgi:hypothetical protein
MIQLASQVRPFEKYLATRHVAIEQFEFARLLDSSLVDILIPASFGYSLLKWNLHFFFVNVK